MNSFKSFFTESELARSGPTDIGPNNPTLNDFFEWLVSNKATIQSIIDLGAFDLGTNRTFDTVSDPSINAAVDFHDALTRFVNRDEHGNGPGSFRPRVYETEEFNNRHNYAEHRELEKQRNLAMRKVMVARRSDDPNELTVAETELSEIRSRLGNTEYYKAYSKAKNAEDEYVKILQSTPFDMKKLSDDGSEEYKQVQAMFNEPNFDINVYLNLLKANAESWRSVRSSN